LGIHGKRSQSSLTDDELERLLADLAAEEKPTISVGDERVVEGTEGQTVTERRVRMNVIRRRTTRVEPAPVPETPLPEATEALPLPTEAFESFGAPELLPEPMALPPAPEPAPPPAPERSPVTVASVTPQRAAAVAASAPPHAAPQQAAPQQAAPAASRTAIAVATPESDWTPEERDLHLRAQRFARLLVDEIKLYNQAKVAEGRAARDLYDRLKEDIDKSRASYHKRYGSTPAASADYFTKELVRILADNDASLLGANFPG